ncbi:MAG TPA: hypothetical protein VLT33_26755 [Labilithrix sp.]|nr:hypothetical protein [Labilithrix sp.]
MTNRGDDTAGTAPAWADAFSPEEWAWFVATLAADLDGRGLTHRIDMETGCVHVTTAGPNVLGLSNLLQVCRGRPREAWAAAVKHHFDVAFDAKDGRTAEELSRDWDLARARVKLRLYERDNLPDVPLVTWEIADGLVAVLTFDLPETVISVRLEDREQWDVTDDDLYDIALANVRAEGLLPATEVDLGDRAALRLLEGGSTFFAATHALFIEDYVQGDLGPYGVVLAIPQRHVVLFHRIHDLRVVRVLEAMIVTATNMYVDGPGSISSDLYWLPPRGEDSSLDDLEHSLVRLPCTITDQTLRFLPPPQFTRMLSSLQPPAESH